MYPQAFVFIIMLTRRQTLFLLPDMFCGQKTLKRKRALTSLLYLQKNSKYSCEFLACSTTSLLSRASSVSNNVSSIVTFYNKNVLSTNQVKMRAQNMSSTGKQDHRLCQQAPDSSFFFYDNRKLNSTVAGASALNHVS